jgi:sirohydrochlorin ferrochelatase
MSRIHPGIRAVLSAACAIALGALGACTLTGDRAAEREAAVARLAAPEASPDELGRRLYRVRHDMTAEQMAELRDAPVFSGANDRQIMRLMSLMGSNYSWYAGAPGQTAKDGVLVLSHGLGEQGDSQLRARLQESTLGVPTAIAFGMSMTSSRHIQLALDELVAAGAERIVVIPVLSTYHNSLMRQWDYVFARTDVPEYAAVAQVSAPARVRVTDPLNDHPIVGAIVAAHAREVSYDPEQEEVIIIGHGPVDPGDNQQQLAMMENIADVVRRDRPYAAVHVATLQDDAPREVRMANYRIIRQRIKKAQDAGRKMIVVTNLLGSRIVQSGLRQGLSGMEYRFNFKGLILHEDFIHWIEQSAADGFTALRGN